MYEPGISQKPGGESLFGWSDAVFHNFDFVHIFLSLCMLEKNKRESDEFF